ncbi:MAG: hypothetical protein BGO51_23770 [Rhodospirillales bacterium 69-11]|nr:hypothetical protein [Rhodospirillales bacterium]MBN8926821.1 hypothetical protein [Rhodospirillales bacterium]OJW22819.1 MAG: hypothetical protein BGO51_23770 [Rhodospirillales bacterium 69-11]
MRLRSLALAALGALTLAGAAAPARADWGGVRHNEAQERAWRIQREREHAWREHERRANAWRQSHRPFAPVRPYAYAPPRPHVYVPPRPYAYAPAYRPYGY